MVNLKKEFINAITLVLRLEQNIFIVGSIENIVDRLDAKDYQNFISFLSQRDSSYEKPLETLGKAVDEYHQILMKPLMELANKKATDIYSKIKHIATSIATQNNITYDEGLTVLSKQNDYQLMSYVLLNRDTRIKENITSDELEIINVAGGRVEVISNIEVKFGNLRDAIIKPHIKLNITKKIEAYAVEQSIKLLG